MMDWKDRHSRQYGALYISLVPVVGVAVVLVPAEVPAHEVSILRNMCYSAVIKSTSAGNITSDVESESENVARDAAPFD